MPVPGCYVRPMTLIVLLPLAALVLLAAYTFFQSRKADRNLVPDGVFATVDGVRLHYHFHPVPEAPGRDGPVLVFLHGASGNAYDTRMAFEAVYRDKLPLLFVDRPGLGFSGSGAARHVSPAGQAQLVAGLLERLEIGNAVVVGHSLAGAVTAALGLAAPERVRGLAFLAPVSHVWPGGVNWYYTLAALPAIGWLFVRTLTLPVGERLAPAMMRNVFHPDPVPAGYADTIRLPLLFRPQSFRANARQICSIKEAVRLQAERYGELKQPALVVTGTQDTVVWPSIHCEGLLRDLPDVELVVLDQAGHMPHHTHTQEVQRALERLLRRIEAKDAGKPAETQAALLESA